MNTLREIGEFIGIPQGSLEVAGIGGPRTTSLHMASVLVTKGERSWMQAIIQALQNLTPITLEAQIVGITPPDVQPLLEPIIRLNASGGIVWFTYIDLLGEGPGLIFGEDPRSNLGAKGGFFPITTHQGPGAFQCVVRRAGISNTGFVSLRKTLTLRTTGR